jgi:S-adenosylmethionine:tRNA ribosyltransferase-isomerase
LAESKLRSTKCRTVASRRSAVHLIYSNLLVTKVPSPCRPICEATKSDTERYQTVFASTPGSVAAPTASLNFTHELEKKILEKGASIVYLTLHVGLGTFLPIRTGNIEDHVMHSEYFEIPNDTALAIRAAKNSGRKILAVGTTVARTLEYAAEKVMSSSSDISGEANIFIYPGYEFKIVNALLTNYHAPKSTVLMLAASFAGWDNLHNAYIEAIKEKYAFLSYGDSMLIC